MNQGLGAVDQAQPKLKLFDVHTKTVDHNLVRSLHGLVDREEVYEKATTHGSVRVVAKTIPEAIEVFYTRYSRYGIDRAHEVTGVVQVSEIDVTYEEYIAINKAKEKEANMPNCATPVKPN